MNRQHFAAPAHDNRKICKECRMPIFIPNPRLPCTFSHVTPQRKVSPSK